LAVVEVGPGSTVREDNDGVVASERDWYIGCRRGERHSCQQFIVRSWLVSEPCWIPAGDVENPNISSVVDELMEGSSDPSSERLKGSDSQW